MGDKHWNINNPLANKAELTAESLYDGTDSTLRREISDIIETHKGIDMDNTQSVDSIRETISITSNTLQMVLRREITDIKETLQGIDRDTTKPVDNIQRNANRISYVLQTISDIKLRIQCFSYKPIPDLLSVGPLTRTELPLDVLKHLISVGFDINSRSERGKMCMDIAVEKHYYNAIRLLLKRGAKSSWDRNGYVEPVITLLASQPNVPLDLFDMLAKTQSLNDCSHYRYLPLHKAVACGHIVTALHLIKLGANVDQQDGKSKLPIEYYMESSYDLSDELFMSLLPKKGFGVHFLRPMCHILSAERLDKSNACMFEMFQQLVQRLYFDKPLMVEIKYKNTNLVGPHPLQCFPCRCFSINGVVVTSFPNSTCTLSVYLCSLILVELQFELASTPDEIVNIRSRSVTKEVLTYTCATNDLWRKYREQCCVRPLLRLCILCIRNSMSRLDNESFLSLPVPPYICQLLTYRDISKTIFEEMCRIRSMSS